MKLTTKDKNTPESKLYTSVKLVMGMFVDVVVKVKKLDIVKLLCEYEILDVPHLLRVMTRKLIIDPSIREQYDIIEFCIGTLAQRGCDEGSFFSALVDFVYIGRMDLCEAISKHITIEEGTRINSNLCGGVFGRDVEAPVDPIAHIECVKWFANRYLPMVDPDMCGAIHGATYSEHTACLNILEDTQRRGPCELHLK
jgi:hypothetical protein